MTAYYAMFEQARLRKGHNILVHSAAGGVGTMLCQMGAIIGCKVVGVVGGAHKVQYALEHGCHHVIDKSSESLWPRAEELAPDGYHAVFGAWWGVDIKAMRLHRPHAHQDPASMRVCRRERCVHAEAVVQPPGADWAVDSVRLPLYATAQGCVRCVCSPRDVSRAVARCWSAVRGLDRSAACDTSGGVLGVKEWIKLAWDYVRTPRFLPLEMTATNRSVMGFNLSFLFGEHELLRKCMLDIVGCVQRRVPRTRVPRGSISCSWMWLGGWAVASGGSRRAS